MKTQFTVKQNELLAMLELASVDETRFVLNGVHFEVQAERVLMVATDGRRLGVMHCDAPTEIGEVKQFTVALPMLRRAIVNKKANAVISIEGKTVHITTDYTISGEAIDGKYPAWRHVLPKEPNRQSKSLPISSVLFSGFIKISSLIGKHKFGLNGLNCRFNGDGGIVEIHVIGSPQFYGVQMPLREEGEFVRPTWLHQSELPSTEPPKVEAPTTEAAPASK